LYWLLKETLGASLGATYDTYITELEKVEKGWEGVFGSYHAWKGMGNSYEQRFANWKKNEGRNLNEEAIKKYFELLKHNLNEGEKLRKLSPEEKADRVSIINYLEEAPKLRKDALEIVFRIDDDISEEKVEEWRNYGNEKKFKDDTTEIKVFADIINNLPDKAPFFAELKTYLTGKTGIPNPPVDSADEQDKLNYYFTLSPEHVIRVFSAFRIKTNAKEKADTKAEMEKAKDSKGILLSKDKNTGYGDGKNFTDDGIVKYHSEKIGGVNHNYSNQQDDNNKDDKKGKSFWSLENPAAIIAGSCLIIGSGLIIAVIVYWEKIAAWWDGPANAEGNGDSDETDDE